LPRLEKLGDFPPVIDWGKKSPLPRRAFPIGTVDRREGEGRGSIWLEV